MAMVLGLEIKRVFCLKVFERASMEIACPSCKNHRATLERHSMILEKN